MEERMAIYKQRVVDFLEIEWATYIERHNRLPAGEGLRRVHAHGYERFRDMLAHILAWWEEGLAIVMAIAENREYERKKYDFDAFNAAAVAKYKDWDEAEFLAHFEKSRQKAAADMRSVDEAVFENRRVKIWTNGVVIHHAREHLVSVSRFLVKDTLENEWSEFIGSFDRLENKEEYLKKQGYASFKDVLAHIIGWWDEGMKVITGFKLDPAFVYDEPDTDRFNVEIVETYQPLGETEMRNLFESRRVELVEFLSEVSDEELANQTIADWLAADVVEHFDEHAVEG
jgi:hypothetical protein